MKTAIFGGTFNPIHLGHLAIADEVIAQTDCDRVLFVPANIPPHKEVDDPGARHRLAMIQASIAGDPRFSVSDCEISRAGVSYTIDTIRYLVGRGIVEPKPSLIVGDDLLQGFGGWKESAALLDECSLIIVHRQYKECVPFASPHRYLANLRIPISSTLVRERVRAGGAWRYLVPNAARAIIQEQRLYGYIQG